MPDFRAGDYKLSDENRTDQYNSVSVANQSAQLIENERAAHAGVRPVRRGRGASRGASRRCVIP